MKQLLLAFGLLFWGLGADASDLNALVTNATGSSSNGIVDLTVSGGVAPYTYNWSGPAGFSANSEDISGLAPGTYTVTVTDAYCGTATLSVTVASDAATGVSEQAAAALPLVVFPNPTSSEALIKPATNMVNASLSMYNVHGQCVMRKTGIYGTELRISLSGMDNGMYLLELTNNGQTGRTQLIKQ